MQLDLFDHSRDVMLRNDVVAALRRRDEIAARQALAVLSSDYPGDSLLTPLAELAGMLAAPCSHFSDPGEALLAVDQVESTVVPAARCVFDAQEAHHWLIPLWRSLATAAMGLAYSAECPRAHAAYMLLKSADWAAAGTQTATIASWRRIPSSLAWMAEARFGQCGLEAAWCLLAELAWSDASLFGELAARLPTAGLHTLLARFKADFERLEAEPDLAWFPAWALIAEPALASVFRQVQPGSHSNPERGARIVMELLNLERQGRHTTLIDQRKRLRDLHAGLFDRYMSTR